jgi:hypothetical protein
MIPGHVAVLMKRCRTTLSARLSRRVNPAVIEQRLPAASRIEAADVVRPAGPAARCAARSRRGGELLPPIDPPSRAGAATCCMGGAIVQRLFRLLTTTDPLVPSRSHWSSK